MEKFLLLIREDLKARERGPQEEFDRNIKIMTTWVESLTQSGNYLSAEPLYNTGKYVSKNYVLSDGPFIESKEGVSGYFLIRAENIEQAVSITQTCPIVMNGMAVIEVRPIMILDNDKIGG
jgi:hypothetical protein